MIHRHTKGYLQYRTRPHCPYFTILLTSPFSLSHGVKNPLTQCPCDYFSPQSSCKSAGQRLHFESYCKCFTIRNTKSLKVQRCEFEQNDMKSRWSFGIARVEHWSIREKIKLLTVAPPIHLIIVIMRSNPNRIALAPFNYSPIQNSVSEKTPAANAKLHWMGY